jgi:hypothetical protein
MFTAEGAPQTVTVEGRHRQSPLKAGLRQSPLLSVEYGGSGRAPQRVPHLLDIGAPRREGNLDHLRRPFSSQNKNDDTKVYFGPIREGENLDLLDISSSCWCQLEEDL